VKELHEKVKQLNYDITSLNEEESALFERVDTLRQHIGKLAKHFKNKFYLILDIAEHTETGEEMVIYKAMYDNYKVYARPIDMFLSKVDKEKYTESKQEYRFEFIYLGSQE
jgi:hypothetical protein